MHDGFTVARVEVSGWLVRKQNGWLAGKCPGNGDALLLSAGKLARQVPGAVNHADALERSHDSRFAFIRAQSAICQRQFDVFINGQISDQIKTLENKTDLAIANARPIGERQVRDLGSL